MFRCSYCCSQFEKRTEKGTCPNCGAPGPKEVLKEAPKLSWYQSTRATIFRKVGYNPLNALASFIAFLLVAILVLAYARPDMRGTLQEPSVLLSIVVLGLSFMLNRFGLTLVAIVAFLVTFYF